MAMERQDRVERRLAAILVADVAGYSRLMGYVWQDYDLCPAFPALNKFLSFWLETLEGPLHSVTVAHARLIKPAEIRAIDGEFRLH
jgi:uncharacterized protein Usg